MRRHDFWRPPTLWAGATAFVLGGGPSLAAVDLERLHGRGKLCAVNEAVKHAPFADLLFFSDAGWYNRNVVAVHGFSGLAVTVSRAAKTSWPALHRIETDLKLPGLHGEGKVRQGRNSGQTTIALAAALGATRIILLGFDMRLDAGRSHFHDSYSEASRPHLYRDQFLPAFHGWNAAAKQSGVAVLNATPGSALTEFPATALEAELGQFLTAAPVLTGPLTPPAEAHP